MDLLNVTVCVLTLEQVKGISLRCSKNVYVVACYVSWSQNCIILWRIVQSETGFCLNVEVFYFYISFLIGLLFFRIQTRTTHMRPINIIGMLCNLSDVNKLHILTINFINRSFGAIS